MGPPHPLVPSPVPPLLPMLGPICTLRPIWQVIFRLQGLALAGGYDKWQEWREERVHFLAELRRVLALLR